MPILYAAASYVAFWLLWPFLLLHRKTRNGQAERLGIHPSGFAGPKTGPRVWMHGSSAGDLLALKPMVGELKRRVPGCSVVMTTFTNSGESMARERLREADRVTYVPWDLPGATGRAMEAIRPDVLVLEYAEIWPNLIRAAKKRGVKVVITNGRFSPDKVSRYQLFFSLVGNPLASIDLFLMREDDEAERILGLGAPAERVRVTGNTKFDTLANAEADEEDPGLARALGAKKGAPLLIAGSTHEGEEALLLPILHRLRLDHPTLRLAIAPRYVDRAPRIVALAKEAGFTAGLRSQGAPDADVVVLDTIGELSAAYRLATLVFVGGSFTNRGGQNILEPAAQGKVVLFGPNMQNFHDSVQVLVGRGGIQVASPEQLARVAGDLLARPEKLAELGALARGAVRAVQGASARNVEEIARLLEIQEAA
ncbi:3-deoxy-D-manno-octulosonic acid transferase [Vulgatibacter incomptus]|uniref:3-deoxy-D-manno-octulosonic acid transferase n=1 Tax=Vulgatibacter incomptus TaxID=1391653 RepID=A0A0K1PB16_9BACT|nr:glycosyltransferase N-terminal domain-containing protein [Vulgatibacter incomptus]AKU90616.1 Lipid IVA 3-deoxy-D-manno-octulosonic acid transferase [Vulgatibacter incomptus]